MGTVVDGGIYHDPEFVGEIERYHERMLLAHQEGTQRVEFEPPQRNALRTAVEPVAVNGSGNGHTPVAPAERAEKGSVPPVFIDHRGEAIVGPGTSKLLTAKRDGDDDEESEDTAVGRRSRLAGRYKRRCISTTSSHRPNFRPTSRSVPTSSKPHAACSAIDASLSPAMRAITEWKPWSSRELEQLVEDQPPDAATLVLGEQVHRVLDGGGVGRARPERRQRPESHHVVGGVFAAHDRDDRRMGTGVLVDPEHLLVEGAGDHVEERGRLGDVVVVDRSDPGRVASLGEADLDAHDRKVPRSRWVANLADPAPLAQLVEHFHGKEGVYGSSP